MKGNTVLVVSDGSAVLGLGDIGPEAALPVMEGKCALFKTFAGVNAVPIVLATKDPRKIIETVVNIAPGYGGVNLEDIAAPNCFEIEDILKQLLTIPVMHDDQHGTAIVVLAGLINAFRVVRKDIRQGKIAIVGAGAAGAAVARILLQYGVLDVVLLDRGGIIGTHRANLVSYKSKLAHLTNPRGLAGGIEQALTDADAVVGVSGPGLITAEQVSLMAKDAIVFALANPIPEIMPDEALRGGASVVATGRSDFPNQVNNSLAFPGVFRGALDHGVRMITDEMKVRAAEHLARLVPSPTPECIIPSAFKEGVVPEEIDERVPAAVAEAIR
jgi:malate dehydrogenase (oxaloacetate-decarboxylating)